MTGTWIRKIPYQVTREVTISEFLQEHHYSHQSRKELKWASHALFVNGESAYMHTRLRPLDLLEVVIEEREEGHQMAAAQLPFPIVYEDQDLLVINKPAGMPSQPSWYYPDTSLGNAAAWYFQEKKEAFVYRCVNRLDKDTSGLILLARHSVSSGILNQMAKERELIRRYEALVEGEDLANEGTITLPISKKPDTANEYEVNQEKGKFARTHYQVMERGQGISRVRLELDTGRNHQIRVHMKAIGHPLIGDRLYCPENTMMKRQALHAGSLSFTHPITGEAMSFEVPLPEDMQELVAGLRQYH